MQIQHTCAHCGEVHTGSPVFGYQRPPYYYDVPEDEKEVRIKISDDFCVIKPSNNGINDHTIYSIRTELLIPIIDVEDPFSIGVWITLSEDNFKKYFDTFDEDQLSFGSFGWLLLSFPYYKTYTEDGFLKPVGCDVVGRANGLRPAIHIHEVDLEIYYDQQNGITWEKALNLFHQFQSQ